MSIWELYTQLFARNWRCSRFARSLSQGSSKKIRKKDVVMIAGRWSSWSILIPQFLWPAMKAGSTAMTQRPRDRVPSGSMLALLGSRRPDRANPPTNLWWSLFLTALAWSTCTGFPLDRQSTRNTIVQTLLPVTFAYSLSSEAVVMRQLRRWKGLEWRSLTGSHKRTSMGPSRICCNVTTSVLQPEEITSKGTRVSCVYYQ